MDMCIMADDKFVMLMTVFFPVGKGLIYTSMQVDHLL